MLAVLLHYSLQPEVGIADAKDTSKNEVPTPAMY